MYQVSLSVLGFVSWVPCKIRVPGLGFPVSDPTLIAPVLGFLVPPMRWVLGLGSLVSPFGSRVSVPGLIHIMGPRSWVSGTTKSLGSRVPFFGYAFFAWIYRFYNNFKNKASKSDICLKHFITAAEETFAELFWIGQN